MTPETSLEQARRHVVEAEPRVLRQKALVDELRAHGHDTRKAQLLLSSMENILRLMREHLAFEEEKRSLDPAPPTELQGRPKRSLSSRRSHLPA